ncbi:DNA repair exonuclease [Halorhabdus sp. CBA1104]|uniref:metallophosphoesterase family protein n=1 Tax=Halorhabdus sp. CBA1104 TaxID=1380432 RepID=UPI0012B2D16F|nr:DNA repair exonuclease [Halorhabdus sp. CBA1104]QGN07921.1 DNA repair exonuclease [Halorhabdus sp. CBA1104]
MSVRFLHTADLHLGSQLKTQHRQATETVDTLSSAIYTAVERLFDTAIEEDVDFVVIAGDLYDEDSRSVKANTFLKEQFDRLADQGIPAYVSYGNHDPVGSATDYVDLPENVYEFDHEGPQEFHYPDEESPAARIWGQSYRDRHESRSMYRRFTPADERVPNIGVLHTGLNPDGRQYVPVARSDLESKDEIHYWALGHIHDPRIHENEQPVAYSGVPQGRQITEPGLGGGYLVELDADGDYEIEFVPTSPVVWQTVEVDVGDEDIASIPDIERRIEQTLEDFSVPTDLFDGTSVTLRDPDWGIDGYVCRWELTGNGPVHETLSNDEDALHELTRRLRDGLTSRKPFVWTEAVRNSTGPPIPSIDELRGDDRVIDEYLALVDELNGEEAREHFRDQVGMAWESVDDHEDGRPDELPLTDDRLDELIERAQERVLEELALRRAT